MSLLLTSERAKAPSRTFSPLALVMNWAAATRRNAARKRSLLLLLDMEDHRLADLGVTRKDILTELHGGRTLDAARRANARPAR